MMKKFAQLSFTKIIALSAVLVLFVNTAAGAVRYTQEKGSETLLSVSDFAMESMAERKQNGVVKYVATDGDPQLLLTVDGAVTGMKFYMESTMPTGEIVVYWTEAEGEGFSERSRTWAQPVKNEENMYSFDLDGQYVHTLRIDPTIYGGNFLTFGDFVLNYQRPLSAYIGISYENLPFIVMYTGILASILKFIQEIFTKNSD